MEDTTADIVHLQSSRLAVEQVELGRTACCIYRLDCSEREGIGLVYGYDIYTVVGNLRNNKCITKDSPVRLGNRLAVLVQIVGPSTSSDHAGNKIIGYYFISCYFIRCYLFELYAVCLPDGLIQKFRHLFVIPFFRITCFIGITGTDFFIQKFQVKFIAY